MANQIRLKRASGSDPGASDLVTGELAVRTDTAKLFTKKDDNSVAEIGGGLSNIVEDTSPQLGGDLQSNGSDIDFADTDKAIFGGDGDLEIFHDGSNSYVQAISNGTGDLYVLANTKNIYLQPKTNENGIKIVPDGAVELYYDNSKKIETNNTGAAVNGNLGINGSGSLFINTDGSKAFFGAGQDLEIYHSGSANYIDGKTVTTEIISDDLRLRSKTGNETYINADVNGAVELYYDNVKTFHTKQNGVVVEGTEGAGAILELRADQGDDNADYFRFYADPTNSDLYLQNYRSGSWETNARFSGNGATELWYDNVKKLETASGGIDVTGNIVVSGTVDGVDIASLNSTVSGKLSNVVEDTSPQLGGNLDVNTKNIVFGDSGSASDDRLTFGDSTDFMMYHNGTSNVINNTSKELHINSSSEHLAKFIPDGAVELYHNNSKKFETTSGGAEITGSINLTSELNFTGNGNKQIDFATLNGSNTITLRHQDGGSFETAASFTANGGASITHNGSTKIQTTSSGISITGNATSSVSSLSDSSTITVNFASASHFTVTLGGNRTFGDPSSTSNSIGSSGSIFIVQDGTGGRTASFHSDYKFAGGTAPTLSTAANAVDRLDFVVRAADNVHCVVTLDVK